MQHILGLSPLGYCTYIPVEALLDAKYQQHSAELMPLLGVRLAFARESDEDMRWNEGRVKCLSGRDTITAHRMRRDHVHFPATHKLIVRQREAVA